MSTSDRRPYLTATVLDQDFLDDCQDNLDNKLELAAEIVLPAQGLLTERTIRVSDRNKYVGQFFYRALCKFPVVARSLGEWLSPELEFSTLQLPVGNVDGQFNDLLAGGSAYRGFVGARVTVSLGLRDVASTYKGLFSGKVTEIGGLQRGRTSFTVIARDRLEEANVKFPQTALTDTAFPDIEPALIGTILPVIYGDWTVQLRSVKLIPDDPASPVADVPIIPTFAVNGAAPGVLTGASNLRVATADHNLKSLDSSNVWLKRSDNYYKINLADIVTVGAGFKLLEIKQIGSGGTTLVDGALYQYASGDEFRVAVKGYDLAGTLDDNIVAQAKHILETYAGIPGADFDANWASYQNKNDLSYPQSAIATFKSRVWIQEPEGVMSYVLSMLEQVRLECFVDRDLTFKLSSLHFEDWPAAPDFKIKNWDVRAGTFAPQLDDVNVWNRAQAAFDRSPDTGEEVRETAVYNNPAAITQMGKRISKKILFPNLYEEATVNLQLIEMLRLASSGAEFIEVTLTPRSILQDLGGFALVNINLGASVFENVPVMFRNIGYDPDGPSVPVKLWSFQLVPYPGYSPSYSGIVGGYLAVITKET